jgi:hypothetical protein
MSFPLTAGSHRVEGPAELAGLVRADAAAGGSVVPGERPSAWLLGLSLPRDLLVALCAGMLREPDAALVAEGVRLAVALHPSPTDPLVLGLLGHHDPALLLQHDPAQPGRSVEDTALWGAMQVTDLSDDAARAELLRRLRHAGLPQWEAAVLIPHGSLAELQRWWPALVSEGIVADHAEAVAARVARGDDGGRWLASRG